MSKRSRKGTNRTFKKSELNRKDRPCPRTNGPHEEKLVGTGPGYRYYVCRRCHTSRTENDVPRS